MSGERETAVRGWVYKAAMDLKVARREMEAPDPVSDAVCFHFQQAAEKLLKAWLLSSGVERPPRTHDLRLLLDLCVEIDSEFGGLSELDELTPYAAQARYPVDIGEEGLPVMPSHCEMLRASRLASLAERTVIAKLSGAGYRHIGPGT